MYDRIVGLTSNGLFISVEENEPTEHLGGSELERVSMAVGDSPTTYFSKPKTAGLFDEDNNDKMDTNDDSGTVSDMVGGLQNQRPYSILLANEKYDVPVNLAISNMRTEDLCFEFL